MRKLIAGSIGLPSARSFLNAKNANFIHSKDRRIHRIF